MEAMCKDRLCIRLPIVNLHLPRGSRGRQPDDAKTDPKIGRRIIGRQTAPSAGDKATPAAKAHSGDWLAESHPKLITLLAHAPISRSQQAIGRRAQRNINSYHRTFLPETLVEIASPPFPHRACQAAVLVGLKEITFGGLRTAAGLLPALEYAVLWAPGRCADPPCGPWEALSTSCTRVGRAATPIIVPRQHVLSDRDGATWR
jgi:hypothetical protein